MIQSNMDSIDQDIQVSTVLSVHIINSSSIFILYQVKLNEMFSYLLYRMQLED